MFCKNCGREIDQKTLEKLMRPSGEPAVCPECGQAVDTAEFCGGFWGLVASGQALQGGSGEKTETEAGPDAGRKGRKPGSPVRKTDRGGQNHEDTGPCEGRIPGVTEADRMLARMILEEDDAVDGAGTERSGKDRRDTGAGSSGKKSGSSGKESGSSGKESGSPDKKSGSSGKESGGPDKKSGSSGKKVSGSGNKAEGSGRGTSIGGFRPVAAAILASAVLLGFLAGRFLPFSSGSGRPGTAETEQTAEGPGSEGTDTQTAGNMQGQETDTQADSLAQADDREADGTAGQDVLSGQDEDGADNTLNAEDGTDGDQSSSSTQSMSGAGGVEKSGYNLIRRSLTEVNGLLIEDAVLYYGSQDSGITFEGEKLRNEWLTGAGGISYVKTGIEESNGILKELNRVYYDKNGDEINNTSGFSRVKYEYDDQGILEKKKYYAMIEGRDKDTKICTAECRIMESGEENVSVEIFEPEELAADKEAFRFRKTERTFLSQDSELPGALGTVRYFLRESDTVPVREEVHEYSRVDKNGSGEEEGNYDYYVEETIRVYVSKGTGEDDSGTGVTSAASGQTTETAETASSGSKPEDVLLQESQESAGTAETVSAATTSEAAKSQESADTAETAAWDSSSYAADNETGREAGGLVMMDLITVRYYFEEDDDQPRLVRMGFFQDERPAEGKAGFSGFTRSYSAGQTVQEDFFFSTGEKTENENTDSANLHGGGEQESEVLSGSGNPESEALPGSGEQESEALPDSGGAESEALPGSGGAESEAFLVSEDPLLTGEAVPGYYSVENPWFFLIP